MPSTGPNGAPTVRSEKVFKDTDRSPDAGGSWSAPGGTGIMPGGSARRICSSCARAAICWANSVVWMPWNRPSSQPTSWACATRSSASLGSSSSVNGSDSRSSSLTSSGASPSSSSLIELSWISFSRARLFSSSGAALTSSSSCLIMLPIRMTLAGCSTISVTGRSCSPSSSWGSPALAIPSGPTTRTWGCSCISGLLMPLVCPPGGPLRTTGVRLAAAGSCPRARRPPSPGAPEPPATWAAPGRRPRRPSRRR